MPQFRVTEDHLKLIRAFNIRWDDCEFGAPAVDPKRPYGNSSALADIAEILGIVGEELTGEEELRCNTLHSETETALQIAIATGVFKPGLYEARPYSSEWKFVRD